MHLIENFVPIKKNLFEFKIVLIKLFRLLGKAVNLDKTFVNYIGEIFKRVSFCYLTANRIIPKKKNPFTILLLVRIKSYFGSETVFLNH